MRTAVRALAIAIIAYFVITLLIITPLLNFVPGWYVNKTWGRTLTTEWVILNPFKLSLDLASAQLNEPDGERFVSLGDSSVNLSVSSLWHEGIVLDELKIHDLYARVVRTGETEFNFSDLLPAGEPPPEEEPGEPLGLTVHHLDLSSEAIVVEDRTREQPYRSEWTGLALDVRELSTVIEEGKPYTLSVTGPSGGTLRWEGSLSLPSARSEGRFEVANLSLHSLWQAAEPWLDFEVVDGRLDLSATYRVNWGEPLAYELAQGRLAIQEVDIAPRRADQLPDTGVGLRSLEVTGIEVDGAALAATVGSVGLDGLSVSGWSEGERISLAEMFGGPADAGDAGGQSDPPSAQQESDADGAQWSASIGEVRIGDSTLSWRSEYTDPATLTVAPIEAGISNLNWPLAGQAPFQLSLSVNDEADFKAQGELAMGDGRGTVAYTLAGLPLPWFNPNLPTALKASITGGVAGFEGELTLDEFAPQQIALDAQIENFSARQEGVETIFTSWNAVRAKALEVDLAGRAFKLGQLGINGYSGRLHIHEDGSINASKIWQQELGAAGEESTEAQQPGDDEPMPETQEPSTGEDESAEPAAPPWSIDIPEIQLSDSEVDFMDESLPIDFRTVIGELNGQVAGISSEPGAAANVDISGSVNGTAPVKLLGTASPFADPLALDLNLTFESVDMALLTPYTATYAGYKIQSGLLDLNLEYELAENKLAGQNKIRLQQFKLGEKVQSDKAIDAPLNLAIAILTDSNGVIELSVPVSGSPADPSFSLGSIIGKALAGAITSVATAPFKVLGGLVGSDEDLQHLPFPAGSAGPDATTQKRMAVLAEALNKRPKIVLTLNGTVNPQSDRERMQLDRLRQQLLEAGLTQEELEQKNTAWQDAIDDRFEQLDADVEAPESLTVRDKQQRIAETIAIGDEQLVELAQARAQAVKAHLVNNEGIAADRAVIASTDLQGDEHRFSGVELTLR